MFIDNLVIWQICGIDNTRTSVGKLVLFTLFNVIYLIISYFSCNILFVITYFMQTQREVFLSTHMASIYKQTVTSFNMPKPLSIVSFHWFIPVL
jgi:hypothetical protein